MEHTILKAQVERDRKLALSQLLRSEAACDRMVAEADSTKACENANIDAQLASVRADMDITLAANTSKRQAAEAYLDAVKARFNARIQQVNAERTIDLAGQQNQMAIRRTDLASAIAEAAAAREDSNRKLAELQKKQSELQTASLVNWSNKLAMFKNGSQQFEELKLDITSRPLVEMPVPEAAPATYTLSTWDSDDAE